MSNTNFAATIILENGETFSGSGFGYKTSFVVGEIVFATSMVGYQEIITDPSYAGQIVVLTFPEIGNYGIDLKVSESKKPLLNGLIINKKCNSPHNLTNEITLLGFLKENKILGVENTDTRLLTKTIRNFGNLKCVITTENYCLFMHYKELLDNYNVKNITKNISTKSIYKVNAKNVETNFKNIALTKVLLIDMGCKKSIIKELLARNCDITVAPYDITEKKIMGIKPDIILISNGPGNPEDNQTTIYNIRQLIGKIPICGICLGHQIIGIALGAKIIKLKYGHHGTNHPVKDLETNKIYITSQNHNYCLTSLPKDVQIIFKSINDETIEGISSKKYKIMSVQFHPEASPGPQDCNYMFDKFLKMV